MTKRHAFYFGWLNSGHFLYLPGSLIYQPTINQPWGGLIDGGLCPKEDATSQQDEGLALLHHRSGWTALAFWDRSGDPRPDSNSVFIFDEYLTFDEIVDRSKILFSEVWARFTFEVRLDAGLPK